MKKIIGYRYQCPKCGYTYKLYNGGARPAADYLCPVHKIAMPAATIEQSEDAMAPVVREDTQRKDVLLQSLACYGCDFDEDYCEDYDEDNPHCVQMMRRAQDFMAGLGLVTGWIPVEDATPDDGQEVLASDGRYVYLVEYDSDCRFGDMDGITAWMLPPEPYRRKIAVAEDKYTLDQILGAIRQVPIDIVDAIELRDWDMLTDLLTDFIGGAK